MRRFAEAQATMFKFFPTVSLNNYANAWLTAHTDFYQWSYAWNYFKLCRDSISHTQKSWRSLRESFAMVLFSSTDKASSLFILPFLFNPYSWHAGSLMKPYKRFRDDVGVKREFLLFSWPSVSIISSHILAATSYSWYRREIHKSSLELLHNLAVEHSNRTMKFTTMDVHSIN